MFKVLGELKGEFSIKLKPGSTSYAITTPRLVALPLMPKVKEELQRMENLVSFQKLTYQLIGVQAWSLFQSPMGEFAYMLI